MAVPDFRGDFVQRVIFAAKIGFLHVGSADERTVERIGPAVVGTLDASGKSAFGDFAKARAAVAADIVVGTDFAGGVARDDDTFPCDLAEEIIAGAGDLSGATCANPSLAKKAIQFVAEQFRVGVIAPGKSHGPRCSLSGHAVLRKVTVATDYYAIRAEGIAAGVVEIMRMNRIGVMRTDNRADMGRSMLRPYKMKVLRRTSIAGGRAGGGSGSIVAIAGAGD